MKKLSPKTRAYTTNYVVELNCLAIAFINQGNMNAYLGDLLLEPGDVAEFDSDDDQTMFADTMPLKFGARNTAYSADPADNPNVVVTRVEPANC